MNRSIKFKAWHTGLKRMFSADEMGEDQLTLMPDGRGFVNISGSSTRLSTFAGDKMIPLQFTGLKDKNGKDVYEGDILHLLDEMFTGPENFTVEWDEKGYWKYFTGFPNAEIIGNIYENPNLLTHAK